MSPYLKTRELKTAAKMFRLNKQVFKSMGYVLQVHHPRTRAISTTPVSSKFNSIRLYTDWLVQRFNDDGHRDTNSGGSAEFAGGSKPGSTSSVAWSLQFSQLDKVYSEASFQVRGIVLIFLRTSRIYDCNWTTLKK